MEKFEISVAETDELFNLRSSIKDLKVVAAELLKRVTEIGLECSDIVEMPGLNVQDKIAVHLLFLSKFSGVIDEKLLRLAAEKQESVYGFVLDRVFLRIGCALTYRALLGRF